MMAIGERNRLLLRSGIFGVAGVARRLPAPTWRRADNFGHAEPGQIGFQEPVTDLARYLQWFHNDILLPLIIVISLFVLALLGYVVWRFNEKANPMPSKTTHNTLIEVVWTIVPVIILVFVAIPSFRLLTMQLTLPARGRQHQGYGVPVALELRLPQGRGRFQLRLLHEGRKGSEAGKRRPAAAFGR